MKTLYKQPLLAIIICMFNEEKIAATCIDKVMLAIKNLHYPIKLIVVDDGSTDATQRIAQEKSKQYSKNLLLFTHKKNKGFGAANSTGVQKAIELKFTWCLHMDAGLTNDPKYIKAFAANMTEPYDCIKASRYIKGGKTVNVPKYRRLFSIIGNTIASTCMRVGIRDCTNGFRMIRLAMLKNVKFKENSYSMILEEMYYLKKKHARFKEIPYVLVLRKNTVSHFSYKPKAFYNYFKYVLKSLFSF